MTQTSPDHPSIQFTINCHCSPVDKRVDLVRGWLVGVTDTKKENYQGDNIEEDADSLPEFGINNVFNAIHTNLGELCDCREFGQVNRYQ